MTGVQTCALPIWAEMGNRAGTIPLSYARAEPELKKKGKMGLFSGTACIAYIPNGCMGSQGREAGVDIGRGMRKDM